MGCRHEKTASVNFATGETNDAKPVWGMYVSVKKFPCLRHKEAAHKHMKKASAAKKDQNEQKKTKMQAPCDNIADILLAGGENRPVWPAPLRFLDCPSVPASRWTIHELRCRV